MTKGIQPYDPNSRSRFEQQEPPRSGDKHYHYYDQRTFVHGDANGVDRDEESDEDYAPSRSRRNWLIVALLLGMLIIGMLGSVLAPVTPRGAAAGIEGEPVSCAGHWSYAPSLEQAMDVYVTADDPEYALMITKLDVNAPDIDFQSISNITMTKKTVTKDDKLVQAVLHDSGGDNTLECRSSGAKFQYNGQTFILKKVMVGLKEIVAEKGWQWPVAPDPNKVEASACEGSWLLGPPQGPVAITVERADNFYAVSLATPQYPENPQKLMATSGDANHLSIDWPDKHFAMRCSARGAGAEFGDGGPAIIMRRLSPLGHHHLIASWVAAKTTDQNQGSSDMNVADDPG